MKENLEKLNRYIDLKGLRHSTSREQIAKVFFKTQDHITVEALLDEVRKINAKIGLATVYRTLNLLQECGLAMKRDFDTGTVTFEPYSDAHHDHLICTNCGEIIEFFSDDLEKLQDKIAKKYGFVLTDHKMELYGHCKNCS
ncbi:MAG: transcriptional repressor [Deltaproteobacteria bacterium]|nr:transcriptional repressor [Deltaproteobacteria bacterium]